MVVKSLSTSWKQDNKRVIVWLILCLQLGKHRRHLPVWRKPLYFLACQSDVSPLFPGVLWRGDTRGGTGATPMVFLSLYSAVAFQSHHTKKSQGLSVWLFYSSLQFFLKNKRMRKAGLEPARYCYHRHLKPARLPIPPLPHFVRCIQLFKKDAGDGTWTHTSLPTLDP